jgi:signal transduction histidine kinase
MTHMSGDTELAAAHLQLLVRTLTEGILVIDERGTIVFANPSAELLFHSEPGKILGTRFGYPVAEGMAEVKVPLAGQGSKVLEMRAVKCDWNGGPSYLVSFQDITLRKESEKKVRHLSLQLIDAEEKGRRDLGGLLHDEVGGSLTMLKMAVHQATTRSTADVKPLLERIRTLADEVLAQVRALSLSLRPVVLNEFSLLEGLLSYFEHYEEQTGIKVNFSHSGLDTKIPLQSKKFSYRIVQEALSNVSRHAGVKSVDIAISCENGFLQIYVEDSGCGFNPRQPVSGRGIGDMKCRASLVGGTLVVESSPGKGTRITCGLPLVLEK